MTQPIPAGFHAMTPSITLKDSNKAIEFYKKAFDATLIDLFPNLHGPGVMHAVIKVGDSLLMMGDEMPGSPYKSAETLGVCPMSLFLYVPDADATFKKAIAAGAKMLMPVADMFWGDRAGSLEDPFKYQWMVATHKRDMTKDEMKKEAEAFFASMSKQK